MIKEKYFDEFENLRKGTSEEIQKWANEKAVLENCELQRTLKAFYYIGDEVISSETEAEYIERMQWNANHPPEMHRPEPEYIPKDADEEVDKWIKENWDTQKGEREWTDWIEEKTGLCGLQERLQRAFKRFGWQTTHSNE